MKIWRIGILAGLVWSDGFWLGAAEPVAQPDWPAAMLAAKSRMLAGQPQVALDAGGVARDQFLTLAFELKGEYPREANYLQHYYPRHANWFCRQDDAELVGTVIPEMLKKLPADHELQVAAKRLPELSPTERLHFFLKLAQACSQLRELTPPTQTRTSAAADALLVEDWLYQADGFPVAEDCRNEIAWTRRIASRIAKAKPQADFGAELAALARLETAVEKTAGEHPGRQAKKSQESLPELLGTSIYGEPAIDIPMPNGTYTLQLLFYEGWRPNGRQADILVEGKSILENYDYWDRQEKNFDGGSVVRYTFTLTDGNLDIRFKEHRDNSHLSGLVLSKGTGAPGVSSHPLRSAADLELKYVLKAVNFGETREVALGPVTFAAAAVNTTVQGVANRAKGMVPVRGGGQHLPAIQAQPAEQSPFQENYVAIRRLKRGVLLKDPAIDFGRLLLVDTPFPMRWVPESPYNKRYPESPFIFANEWNHQSHHRNGFNALSGSRLLLLDGLHPGGEVRMLAPGQGQGDGAILRPDLSFDGKRLLFSYKAEDEMNYHLYEMNIDGTGLRQLTFGNYDDNDPVYLPDGHILFASTRGNTYVRCMHYSHCTTLCRCDADGGNIYLVSQNSEPDWLPSLMADGRILFTRWEYSDKNVMRDQGLWTTNPDGTGTQVLWGSQSVWPDNLSYPRQIPGSAKVMFDGAGHHCIFNGSVGIVDPQKGREYPDGLTKVTPDVRFEEVGNGPVPLPTASQDYHAAGKFFSYKFACPLSESLFLVSAVRGEPNDNYKNSYSFRFAGKFALYLMDIEGNKELVYSGEHNCFYALPLKPRQPPPVVASSVQWPGTGQARQAPKPGSFYSNDVYEGSGIPRGEAKFIRVVSMDYRTYTTWFSSFYLGGSKPVPQISGTALDAVKTVLGTVPVEADGSFYFTAPAGQQLFFELLDKDYRCLQIMRSFVGVMPGENRGCVGCHERQTNAPASVKPALALRRPPSSITPEPWGTGGISYKKMIQPVFDKNCAACHMGDGKARKALDLTCRPSNAMGAQFCEPYLTLLGSSAYMKSLGDKKNYAGGYDVEEAQTAWKTDGSMRTFKPKSRFSYTSPLLALLKDGKHHGVKLSEAEWRLLIAWIDCNTPYRNDADLRETPDPVFPGAEMIPIRPQMKNAPHIQRP